MPYAFPLELAAFLLGLLLGSFLNVCIARLPFGRSVVKPRSQCAHCLQTIHWYDNIPLLSWVLLGAKCRQCKATIPWRYPLVELATGCWFAVSAAVLLHTLASGTLTQTPDQSIRLILDGVGVMLLGFGLIGLMVMDWQTHTLPDLFTLSGAAIGFFLVCIQAIFLAPGEGDIHLSPRNNLRMSSPGSFAARGDVFLTGTEALVMGRLASILAAAGVLLLINAIYKAVRGRDGMGFGDAKLLAMIAGFLGFTGAMLSFFLGMIACSGYAVYLLARGKATAATKLPLGSFLAAGGLAAALIGDALLTWYKGLL